jgi:crossover junction endodeoxyribonuclease RuvC
MVDVAVVTTSSTADLGERLVAIETIVCEWLDRTRPDALAIERVFSQHNVKTVMGVAQVSGVLIAAATRRGVPVALHTPSEVKAAVTGHGRADKAQVAAMVVKLLKLPAAPKPVDASDALALAICHVWRGAAQQRIDAAILAAGGARK